MVSSMFQCVKMVNWCFGCLTLNPRLLMGKNGFPYGVKDFNAVHPIELLTKETLKQVNFSTLFRDKLDSSRNVY